MAPVMTYLPMAAPFEGEGTADNFYAQFVGRLEAHWSPGKDLDIHVDDDPLLARLHAPFKTAMRFVPSGEDLHGETLETGTLLLTTWPPAILRLRKALGKHVPAEVQFRNVNAVRTAVEPLYNQHRKSPAALNMFMTGNGLVRVPAGTVIGLAGGAPDSWGLSSLPNAVRIRFLNARGEIMNPISTLFAIAEHAGIDKTHHPILSKLGSEDWVEILATDNNGKPLKNAAYALYLSDGTHRKGSTDSNGRIYETGLPLGNWAIDIIDYPTFRFD